MIGQFVGKCGIGTRAIALGALLLAGAMNAAAQDTHTQRQYTFSWQFESEDALAPRGGTSRGAPVKLAAGPSEQWLYLRAPGITKFERDRRAILAMAGDYRTSFDFIETVGFAADFEAARPYQSWGTERIYVAEDTGRRIVLQHVLSMVIQTEEGELLGPFVQKHWQQEWVYEPQSLHVYAGGENWQRIEAANAEQRWAQSVYQVDDSPRYAALGRWEHSNSYSAWKSDETWRPLPRRESSVRDDYSVLIGTNRHTILPVGWVQEEENLKTLLNEHNEVSADTPFLARELGVNRYELIEDFDFSAADDYWQATQSFWSDVRDAWRSIFSSREQFEFVESVDEAPLWQSMFEYAAQLEAGTQYEAAAGQALIEQTLARHLR